MFKKRPRAFFGTRRQDLPARESGSDDELLQIPDHSAQVAEAEPTEEAAGVEATAEAETQAEVPVPVTCASGKKIALSPYASLEGPSQAHSSPSSEYEYVGKMEGYRLVSCGSLLEAVSKSGVCSVCRSPLTVKEDLVTRRGLVSKIVICCTNDNCGVETPVTDPYGSETRSLNARSVMAGREIRRGRASLNYFFGLMDMLPPVANKSCGEHLRRLAEVAMECSSQNMRATSNHLHELSGVSYDDILDVCVTYDGTWSKRGFTATYGIVAWETGQVFDFEIRSKRCTVCSKKLTSTKWEEDSEEFRAWYKTHEGVCQKNHEGSSGAMEVMAALEIWKRSEEHLHLRFTEVISDGDAKTVTKLQESKPYGEGVTITKYECVGHVQKRVGKGLRGVNKQVLAANRQVRPVEGRKETEREGTEKL